MLLPTGKGHSMRVKAHSMPCDVSADDSEHVFDRMGKSEEEPITTTEPQLKQYRIFDETLLLMSEVRPLTAHLDAYVKGLSIPPEHFRQTTLRFAVFNAPRRQAILCCPEVGFVHLCPQDTLAYMRFRRFLRNFTFDSRYSHYPFHACCVVGPDGRAALLAGAPTAGKTSLTAALLQRGFRFAADDQVYLQTDGQVVSYPVGSSVSERTFALIPELRPFQCPDCRFRGPQGWEWTVYYGDVFSSVPAYTAFRVSHLFFVTPNFGGESVVTECSPDAAVWHFLNYRHVDKNHIIPLSMCDPENYDMSFGIMRTLASSARFFSVANGDLHVTADIIVKTIDE